MKSLKKWFFLLIICLAGMMFLSGCNKLETMTIDTQLNINQSFNGDRVMTMNMPQTIVKYLFGGDRELLRQTIEKYCPEDMACSIEEAQDSVLIKMMIPFASLSEYRMKVSGILKDDDNPQKDSVDPTVYYDVSDTMFKHGYVLKESFKSVDLFYWLIDGIKTEFPDYADEDLSMIYTEGQNQLIYNGNVIDCGSYIDYSTMESTAFKKVVITTDMTSDNQYDVTVDLTIDRDKYDALRDNQINTKMSEHTMDGIFYTMVLSNTEKTFRYQFTADDENAYVAFMNCIFDSDDSVFEISEQRVDNEALKAQKLITCYVNAGYFVDFSDEEAQMLWVFHLDPGYTAEDVSSQLNYLEKINFENDEAINVVSVETSASDTITLKLGTDVNLLKVIVENRIYSAYNMEREIDFYLPEDKEALVDENIVHLIEGRLNDQIAYERRIDAIDHNVIYAITLRGDSPETLARLTCALLDGNEASGNSVMTGGLAKRNTLRQITMDFQDKIDFTHFFGGSNVTDGIYYRMIYPKSYTVSMSNEDDYTNVAAEYNTLSCMTKNKSMMIKSTASRLNINGILQLISWYLSLAVILVIILLNIPTIFRCVKARRIDWRETGLFSQKGHFEVTVLAVAVVVFVVASIRLIFKVY